MKFIKEKYQDIESQKLAEQYGADNEIVRLGALLHNIALICKVGDRKDHHINGKILAEKILNKYSYPKEKMDRVLSCVYNHIALFFVDGKYHKRGIGRKLYQYAIKQNNTGYFTVNSSPYAHEVYKHLGFEDTDEKQSVNGLIFYPMKNDKIN